MSEYNNKKIPIITAISYEELSKLIKEHKVYLNNEKLLFGKSSRDLSDFIKAKLHSDGYIVGIHGRTNKNTFELMEKLKGTPDGMTMIEAEINVSNVIKFKANTLAEVIDAIRFNKDKELIIQLAEEALARSETSKGITVICAPFIELDNKVKISSKNNLQFEGDSITFVKIE